MEYVSNDRKFNVSYSELKQTYYTFVAMTDEEFVSGILAALHFACFVCYFKEIPGQAVLCDTGLIHELVHIAHTGVEGTTKLADIRADFEETLRLA